MKSNDDIAVMFKYCNADWQLLIIQGSYRQVCVKFKDFSSTF